MVKIDSVLSSSKYAKQIKEPFYKKVSLGIVDPSIHPKLVHPISTRDRCLLHSISFTRKAFVHHPFITVIILFTLFCIPFYFWPIFNCSEIWDDAIKDIHSKFSNDIEGNENTDFILPVVNENGGRLNNIQRPASPPEPTMCANIANVDRFDCFPQGKAEEESCKSRGCCWALPQEKINKSADLNVPYCFYPNSFNNYQYINVSVNDLGATAYLKILFSSPYPKDVELVKLDVMYETENRLHIKIYDANDKRFEIPFPDFPELRKAAKNTKYYVDIDKEEVGFRIVRKSNNQTIFDTQGLGGFIFSNQFLQISAKIPSKIYGLGQQFNNFMLDTNWNQISLFTHDTVPQAKTNLYGVHPFYLAMEGSGLSSGVLLLNSNAMDIILQPSPAITYRMIGGIFNFYIFMGPSPADVVRQYVDLMQYPAMPPYWGLGFHLCRYGYKTLKRTIEVWNRTVEAGIPLDTQWNDLDYMAGNKDFTYNKTSFNGLPEFVDHLHKSGMHYIPLIDPGISGSELPGTYLPYDEGIKNGIFIMDPDGVRPFIGKVWNSVSTVFPDFSNPAVVQYWIDQLRRMQKLFKFDGAWIDMNDPSNFYDGEKTGCPNNTWENPPYLPGVAGGKLSFKTVCMSAKQYKGLHYDLHNLYGTMEAIVTSYAMSRIREKRPFVISRSSFSGHGHYAGIWTGDIESTWEHMHHSISDIMSFSLFGIPLAGADICGFNGNTTPSLCQRWSQLGAFYPFSRNHNSDDAIDQDPVALGPTVVSSARKALFTRYYLLPYLYTLFYGASTRGDTVVRPLFFEYPNDEQTFSITTQFLWGSGLLICPVLKDQDTYVSAYLPSDRWYDFYSFRPINSNGSFYSLSAPLDTIPLLLRGGQIIPTQEPNVTTTLSRKNKMGLLVSLDNKGNAAGELFWDDGDSLDVLKKMTYNLITFSASSSKLSSKVQHWGYNTTMTLGSIKVLGVESTVQKVILNGNSVTFVYQPTMKYLTVNSTVNLEKPFVLTWN
uniref:P-type domain-containing protein n=1 Tax=Clastoptera arizonana TaxID=38151 RepID=A0A1B6D5E9_9HEMI